MNYYFSTLNVDAISGVSALHIKYMIIPYSV